MIMKLDGGELIRLCRKQAGLTQRGLAQKVGITTTSLWRYETGRDMPRWDKVQWCLEACGYELEVRKIDEDTDIDTDTD